MGRPKDLQPPAPYRDDDTASSSSAVPLQDQTYAIEEAPPAYTDDPVRAKGPRRVDDDEEPLLTKPLGFGSVYLEPKVVEDPKGSIITYTSKAASTDPGTCQFLVEHEVRRSPGPMVRMIGSHVETRQRDKKEEKQRVTDFDITAPLGNLLAVPWARSKVAENAQKTYRGGIIKRVDPRLNANSEDAYTAPSLKEWCHRFCASSASAKSFTISRNITGLEYSTLSRQVTEAIRSTNYRGHISVTYPVRSRATIIMSDHWLNRYRHNPFIWWTCVILQLWIFTWPLLWIMTKRWEIFSVEWPGRIHQNADESWPTSHQTDTGRVHEGQPSNNGNVRIANMSEVDWVERWKLAIQTAAESKKRGTFTEADIRVAQAVEERARQRQDHVALVSNDGFLSSATGLLSGIQDVMARSQTLRGWGNDC